MNILIIDTINETIFPLLKNIGVKVDYKPNITREEVIAIIHHYDGLIVRSKTRVDAELLGDKCKLKFVARPGAGIDLLDQKELAKRGIEIFNSPEGNRDALGEHTLGMLLSLANNIVRGDKEVRSGVWDREGNRGFEIKGKTVGIVGYGYMGSAFAEKLSGLSCKVIAYDNLKTGFSNDIVSEVTLEKLYEQTDIVSFHIPLNEVNLNLVDEAYLSKFKKSIYLLNAARGKVLILNDLLRLLDSGKIKGAALDVLENENISQLSSSEQVTFDKLASSDKVILTPHVGGWTFESYVKMNTVLVDKIQAFICRKKSDR